MQFHGKLDMNDNQTDNDGREVTEKSAHEKVKSNRISLLFFFFC